ncbi:MAG: hypothetical protein GY811_05980 [Myxococcales bacterium]|nr:hypothetical protein [Myxococcales bacterium]
MASKKKQAKGSRRSSLEDQFLRLWKFYDGVELEEEYVFYPGRRWRADFCHLDSKVLIEIEGGIWNQGRHTRGKGYQGDCEKYNHAAMDGWAVIRLAGKEMISREWIDRIQALIGRRS